MTTFESPLQKAIYTALSGNVTINGSPGDVVPVYDHIGPTEKATFPRIQFGEVLANPWDDKTAYGEEIFVTLDIWSRERGKKQTQDIMSAIHTLLQNQDLSLDVGDLVILRLESPTRILNDPDGLTYHGVQTWRATVHA